MNSIQNLSLINGPLPIVLYVLGVAGLLFLLFRRSLRWWLFALVAAVAALLVGFGGAWLVVHVLFWWPEELPAVVAWLVSVAVWGFLLGGTTAFAGFRRARTSRRKVSPARGGLAVLATILVFVMAGLGMNAAFGQYPSVGSLFTTGTVVTQGEVPVLRADQESRFMASAVSTRWTPPAGLPTTGAVHLETIPGTASGFHGRKAVVYLPPAYAAAQRPVLPVLVMVSGQPGSPQSWLRATSLISQLDTYAQAHGGLAPIVVIPDPNGADSANTMCMNSKLGQADTYMAQDVPAWIKSHLEVDSNPAHWAVGGFSYGATCSLQMVTRHPDTYQTFLAISPEREPALAVDRAVTVQRAFDRDTAAFDAVLPLTLMAKNMYPQIHGWFAVGSGDTTYSANVKILEAAARKSGMSVAGAEYPGGHSWTVADAALPQGLGFVFTRLGLP